MLEGVGLLEKKSKNNIQWKFGHSLVSLEQSRDMMLEAEQLEQKENHLDDMIRTMRDELNSQLENTTHAYITHQDLRGVEMFRDQMVIIIKAPPEAKLVVSVVFFVSVLCVPQWHRVTNQTAPFCVLQLPDLKMPREIHMKAEKGGEIDVFLCPDANWPSEEYVPTSSTTTAYQPQQPTAVAAKPAQPLQPLQPNQQQQHQYQQQQPQPMPLQPHVQTNYQQQLSTPCDPLLNDIKPLLTPIIEKYLSPRFRKGEWATGQQTCRRFIHVASLPPSDYPILISLYLPSSHHQTHQHIPSAPHNETSTNR